MNIEVIEKVPFENIEELDLSFNKIKSAEPLLKRKFNKMKDLKIEGNENLDYTHKNIQKIYDDYNIKYTFNSIL